MEVKERKLKKIGICQGRLTNPPGNELQWFPGDKWIDEFKIAKKLSYDFIEILAERNHNPNNPIWNAKGQSQIKEVSRKNNIKMYSGCLDYIINNSIYDGDSLSQEVLAYTKNFINCCSNIGINLVILPLLEKSNITLNKIDLVKSFLEIIYLECSKLKINISIESIASPEIILKVLSPNKKDKVGCVYDTGNRVLTAKDMPKEIKTLSKYINHIHLKDRDNKNQNIVIGTGIVNFVDVFKTLKEINYKGRFTFESNRGTYVYETALHNLNFIRFVMKDVNYYD